MKVLKILMFTLTAYGFFSCGDDECAPDKFLGSYIGENCEQDEMEIQIYEAMSSQGVLDLWLLDGGDTAIFSGLTPMDCNLLVVPDTIVGRDTGSVNIELMGNQIIINLKSTLSGDCVYSMTK